MTLYQRLSTSLRPARLCLRTVRTTLRHSSTDAPAASAILSRLREDLKNSMRAKDQMTLTTIRSILADITNMSKTSTPVTTDSALRTLLLKKVSMAENSIEEFQNAKREDLVEKESGMREVLRRYVVEIEDQSGGLVSEEEMRVAVKEAVDAGEGAKFPKIMAHVLGKGGKLEGRLIDKKTLSGIVSEALKK
ncbi:GatB/YqeY domain-containing protein [Saccharata proteae CBS 121410]|uniref:Altered inheritance of mitochondria protein 41 n=1 Tax=Saccharata proteae CBS 121410 TaxID=1314787 RepID=A0A9P4I1H3_9PEZI|nr:GatB/YqeY domain-containing protein [Saccharata proteae CBS 121410]